MTRLRPFCLPVLVLLAGAACNGGGAGSPVNPVEPTPPGSSPFFIDIAEINGPFSFYPLPANSTAGQPIIWRNHDGATHHLVFDAMSIDTGNLAPGTLSQPVDLPAGRWTYHCVIYPEMIGTVTVTSTSPTASAGASSGFVHAWRHPE
jgi:hypothetical protein